MCTWLHWDSFVYQTSFAQAMKAANLQNCYPVGQGDECLINRKYGKGGYQVSLFIDLFSVQQGYIDVEAPNVVQRNDPHLYIEALDKTNRRDYEELQGKRIQQLFYEILQNLVLIVEILEIKIKMSKVYGCISWVYIMCLPHQHNFQKVSNFTTDVFIYSK